ncbi:MAG: hypothetical protein QOF45_306 [Gaiellaceae bacterium]|jgi:hypothetical protein|nr:hypothetical protein [Gaiellaceae bacterium]
MLRLIAFAFVSLALVASTAAADGGPAPGVVTGWDGTVDPTGAVRYVALPAARATTVAAVRKSDGRILRWVTVRGVFGVPQVAFDGTTEGVSRDGKTLVLATYGGVGGVTSFAVLRTVPLRLRKTVTLRGNWSFDALSRDGRTLYAIEYLGTDPNPRYNVRAVSLVTGKPVGGAIVDKREADEEMNGSPWARARSANGAWAYTLYAKLNGTAFVHALDTASRRAFCVDLPWRTSAQRLAAVRLSLADGGRSLELARRGGNRLALVDTTTFKVTAFAKP